jgi:hypothetical protein
MTYKIPEPDIGVAAKAESGDLPLFSRQIEIELCSARNTRLKEKGK